MRIINLLFVFTTLLLSNITPTFATEFSGFRSPAKVSSTVACLDLVHEIIGKKFANKRLALEQSLASTMNEEDRAKLLENLDSLLFIDYPHTLAKLLQESPETPLHNIPLNAIYNRRGIESENFKTALSFLRNESSGIRLENLKKLHTLLMSGNVDYLDSKYIGEFREDGVGGSVFGSPISETIFQELQNNSYITTSRLNKTPEGTYRGMYSYPSLYEKNVKPELLNELQATHPKLYADIVKHLDQNIGDENVLQKNLVTALSENLLEWFVKQRDQIGPIKDKNSYKKFVTLVAQFHKKMISIHPFKDGNGRTVRMFALYYPFILEGLPPPRLVDVNADLYSPLDLWVEQIENGVESTLKLYQQIIDRNSMGLPLLNTAELFFPNSPISAPINLLKDRPKKLIKNHKDISVDPAQFMEYVQQRRLVMPELTAEISDSPYTTLKVLKEEYQIFVQKSQMEFIHEKFGDEYLSLWFADFDFRNTFNNKSFRITDRWKFKMNRWYDDEIIWRGLANRHKEMDENEILSIFKRIHPNMCSNSLLRQMPPDASDEIITKLAQSDFEKYNQDLINNGLEKMAQDHSDSGPMYGISYGYSTSQKREVGKAFAMGAMVIAKYGEHHDLEKQALLKSRVLIGAKRSIKDINLSRLKKLRPDFSYHYPRQKEVMGIGAADPDSIMIVQTIDAHGEVIKSYLRNPDNPKEIWIIDGEASTLPSDMSRVLEKIILE